MRTWFENWKEKQQAIITPENYASREEFEAIINGFEDKNIDTLEVNPLIAEQGALLNSINGKRDISHYVGAGHPAFTELENRLTAMETAGLTNPDLFSAKVSSRGMAAISEVLKAIRRHDLETTGEAGRIIYGNIVYPGTNNLLSEIGTSGENEIGTKPGIQRDTSNLEEVKQILKEKKELEDKVSAILIEPVANPTLDYSPIRELADLAHSYGIPLIVDNTFLSPALQRPLGMGADIIIHSLTKYLSGTGDKTGGVVIAPKEFINIISNIRNNYGQTMDIKSAIKYIDSVTNISKVMDEHSRNSKTLSTILKQIPEISVNYKDLGSQTRDGSAGGVVSFEFHPNGPSDKAFMSGLKFNDYLKNSPGPVTTRVSFGESKTIAFPYAGQIPDKNFLESQNDPLGLVRVAVGRENPKEFKQVIQYLTKAIKHAA